MPVPTAAPAERTLIRDQVSDKIRGAILDGTLEPGERLHDDELIAWLGVSRTPIRESLAQLADEGLVETAANRYTRVPLPDPREVLDALRTLGVLFGGIIRITCLSGRSPTSREPRTGSTARSSGCGRAARHAWC